MADAANLVEVLRAMQQEGQPLEAAISTLRNRGRSKGESVLILADAYQLDMADATRAVHESSTWADQSREDEELNASIWNTLAESGEPQDDGSVDITDWINSGEQKP